MFRKTFVLLQFLFLTITVMCQDKINYITLGSGYSYISTRDKGVSPLLYQGHHTGLKLRWIRLTEDERFQDLKTDFYYGMLKPKVNPELSTNRALSLKGNLDYGLYFRSKKLSTDKLDVFLGSSFLSTGVYRRILQFVNNAYNYEYVSSLTFNLYLSRNFNLSERKLSVHFYFKTPILSTYIRPSYNSSYAEGFLENWGEYVKATFSSLKFGTYSVHSRFKTETDLLYHLKNGNRLGLGYEWDLYHFSKPNPITSAGHTFTFSLLFNLTKIPDKE